MTEIEPYLPPTPEPTGRLALWVNDFKGVAEVAAAIARTRFAPESLYVWRDRDGHRVFDAEATTAQVAAVIMTGQELGMSPMAALRSVDIIQGQPALRAIALRAVLLAQGHEIYVESATNTRATVVGRRRGSDHEQSISWSMDDAKSRNLAGKPNWRTQPRNMLIARATADVARLIAADALLGLPYTVEELEDGVDGLTPIGGSTGDGTPAPARRTRRPKVIDQNAVAEKIIEVIQRRIPDSPPLDEQPAAAEQQQQQPTDEPDLDDAGPDPISPQQSKLLHKLLRDRYGDDRDSALNGISEQIRRPVDTTKNLTIAEASELIDWLSPDPTFDDEPDNPDPGGE